jgi:glycerol-3-phosphate acyltransferase PlsY
VGDIGEMTAETQLTLLCVAAYFLGSIPVGVLAARAKGIDITQVGSGNVGATNVNRALGKQWGIAVFILDMLKGLAPTLAARYLVAIPVGSVHPQAIWMLVGIFAVLGHTKSVFLHFKGGKGISTSLGVCLGAAPLVAVSAFTLFVIILASTRYMSVASILAVASSVLFAMLIPGQSSQIIPLFALLAVAVIALHRKNIGRLRAGTEPKFAFVSKKE